MPEPRPLPSQAPTSELDEPQAFSALYDAHVDYVARLLLRFSVERRHLEDVLQEVFVVVHRRLPSFDASRPLRPWLCGIAFRTASDWRRRAFQREVPSSDDALDAGDVGLPTQDRCLAAQEEVERGLAALTFEQRAVVVLCDLEGHSADEAGRLLQIPPGTVYSRLHEARRRFIDAVRATRREP